MWNWSIKKHLTEGELSVDIDSSEQIISNGEFLDTYGTIAYKQKQIAEVSRLFMQGLVKDGDTFYAPDIFYPGLEAIKYMAELSGIKVTIATFNHAGRADQDDFVQKLSSWADTQEQAWHDLSDLVFVGSHYQERRVIEKFSPRKIVVSGAIWDKEWMDNICKGIDKTNKEDYVIFPHRPCKEKRFDFFLQVARDNPRTHFVITSSGNKRVDETELPSNVEYWYGLTKKQYFEAFAKARGYLSTAYQETFGYTIQEAIYFGCQIICPRYACYEEYVAEPSILTFKEMAIPGALDTVYKERGELLKQSAQLPDNAEEVCKQIRLL